MECYRCGEPGHTVLQCSVDKNAVKCTYCGMVGHVEKVCAKQAQLRSARAVNRGGGSGVGGQVGAGAGTGQGGAQPQRG